MKMPMPSRLRAGGPFAVLLAMQMLSGLAFAGDPPASASVASNPPAATLALPEGFWAARSDRYSVAWGSVSLGEGTISLKPTGSGCYDYRSTTDPIALVRWTYGSPSEASRFCVSGGLVHPQRFQYSNDRRSDDNFSLDFDAGTQRVKKIKGGVVTEINAPDPSYDRFSIREAVRLWAAENADRIGAEQDFAFIDDKDVRTYRFRIEARETVQVPAGKFETLRVARIDHPKKSYRYWLAPSRDYVPVKIQHINKGKTELSMELLGAG
ncbi:DUF3108 domain-containing protein [Solimonas soli]|uniref:DUF3108 domain-containing protein n=1 Tax=Solimonas soli TaxID=413479 RepID=UPI0004859011|nr:DUF3108 domain-containing protein [Solimonas soli]